MNELDINISCLQMCNELITDNEKRWKATVEKNPLHVFGFSGPVYLAVDTFLLLG
jgi:hypothetical protein